MKMEADTSVLNFIFLLSTSFFIAYSSSSSSSLLGVHPLDENYFTSGVIKCKDGSKSFTRDRVNDDFCDCSDGTDEPGTSACPAGKFYCRNVGSTPQFLFSSRVNDRICDCCDGSDENDGSIRCPNSCVMGWHVEYTSERSIPKMSDLGSPSAKETQNKLKLENPFQNATGIEVLILVQAVLITLVAALRLSRRRAQPKRRHHRGRIPP